MFRNFCSAIFLLFVVLHLSDARLCLWDESDRCGIEEYPATKNDSLSLSCVNLQQTCFIIVDHCYAEHFPNGEVHLVLTEFYSDGSVWPPLNEIKATDPDGYIFESNHKAQQIVANLRRHGFRDHDLTVEQICGKSGRYRRCILPFAISACRLLDDSADAQKRVPLKMQADCVNGFVLH